MRVTGTKVKYYDDFGIEKLVKKLASELGYFHDSPAFFIY